MAALLPHGVVQYHHEISRILVFGLFFGEIITYFRERDVITTGIPQNRGFPAISCTISCRNVSYDTLI